MADQAKIRLAGAKTRENAASHPGDRNELDPPTRQKEPVPSTIAGFVQRGSAKRYNSSESYPGRSSSVNVERFYETLDSAIGLDRKLELQLGLDSIRDALSNITAAPAQPVHQSALANAIAAFSDASAQLGNALTPTQADSIAEIGGAEFFDPRIADTVRQSIAENAMTPSVARDFVKDLASRRSIFLETMQSTLTGLNELGVKSAFLEPGSADLAFLIPRNLFDDKLGEFAKELIFITRLIETFSEALSGEHQPTVLEGLSSSVPTVAIGASVGLIMCLANLVNKFLEAWERVERIRKMRAEMSEMGIEGAPIEVLTKQIAATVRGVVDESVRTALANYEGKPTRKNELETALRQGTRRLFGQIERGLKIQFRAEPKKGGAESERKALEEVARMGREMKFPRAAEAPLLLENGEVLDGELPEIERGSAKVIKRVAKNAEKTDS